MNHLKNQSVIVTGANRGIGEATARHFAQNGARVVLAARSGEKIDAIADEIKAAGGSATAVTCDVGRADDVQNLIQTTVAQTGRIDVLINNAGLIEPIARITQSDPEAWGQVIDVNLKGVYYGMRYCIPAMVSQGGGTIITLSSGAATSALEGWSHYCATKAAVLSLTRVADKENRQDGIRVLGLSPGTVATGMQRQIRASGINPVSQLDPDMHIPPEWVARALAWLAGPQADPHLGTDFSLKSPENRLAVGLPANSQL